MQHVAGAGWEATVVSGMRQAKRPVSALLAGPYGHPYHPMLVTIPIGSWIASLGFDLASHLVSSPGFLAEGSQWLIGIGVLGAVVAGLVGLLDLAAIPVGTAAFRTACMHMFLNMTLTFGYAADFAWRYHAHAYRAPVNPVLVAISAVSVSTLCVSGYLGGKLTYRYGVRVASERTQALGYLQPGEPLPSRQRAELPPPSGAPSRLLSGLVSAATTGSRHVSHTSWAVSFSPQRCSSSRGGPVSAARYLSPHCIRVTMTGYRSRPASVSPYSNLAGCSEYWRRSSMPEPTSARRRAAIVSRGAPVLRTISSNRRLPRNTSRTASSAHFSPTTSSVRATEHSRGCAETATMPRRYQVSPKTGR